MVYTTVFSLSVLDDNNLMIQKTIIKCVANW